MENKLESNNVPCEILEPSLEFKDSFLRALNEYKKLGIPLDEGIDDPGNNFEDFVQHLKDEAVGKNMKPGLVPQTTFWITDKDGYAGRISIRHELNEKLLKSGGNIGYGIIPTKRGLGYGKKALEAILPKARELGLKKVLLTCDDTNIGSYKIIEANGGIPENKVTDESGQVKRRYWITL